MNGQDMFFDWILCIFNLIHRLVLSTPSAVFPTGTTFEFYFLRHLFVSPMSSEHSHEYVLWHGGSDEYCFLNLDYICLYRWKARKMFLESFNVTCGVTLDGT